MASFLYRPVLVSSILLCKFLKGGVGCMDLNSDYERKG